PRRERESESELTARAARELNAAPVGRDVERREKPRVLGMVPGRIERRRECAEPPRRHPRVKVLFLRDVADLPLHADGYAALALAEELDAPRIRLDDAHEHAQRRRLAGAVAAEEAVHLAARHGERQPVQG